jgi:hypothetical protein
MRRNRSRFSATVPAHLLGRLVVHIGEALPDQVLGPGVELLEVVRGVVQVLAPVEAEPADVGLDGVDVGLLLLHRVGVVEAQVAAAAELLGHAEVKADRLGVADVEEPVRLGRKAGDHRRHAAGVEVGLDDVADEVPPGRLRSRSLVRLPGHAIQSDCLPGPAPGAGLLRASRAAGKRGRGPERRRAPPAPPPCRTRGIFFRKYNFASYLYFS